MTPRAAHKQPIHPGTFESLAADMAIINQQKRRTDAVIHRADRRVEMGNALLERSKEPRT